MLLLGSSHLGLANIGRVHESSIGPRGSESRAPAPGSAPDSAPGSAPGSAPDNSNSAPGSAPNNAAPGSAPGSAPNNAAPGSAPASASRSRHLLLFALGFGTSSLRSPNEDFFFRRGRVNHGWVVADVAPLIERPMRPARTVGGSTGRDSPLAFGHPSPHGCSPIKNVNGAPHSRERDKTRKQKNEGCAPLLVAYAGVKLEAACRRGLDLRASSKTGAGWCVCDRNGRQLLWRPRCFA
jgi:hypothetical protein